MSKQERKSFDEIFKHRIKRFFEPFATVKTEFEILKLPKKIDILIIEPKAPIDQYVELFTYFKSYNIIEFKSERDRFKRSDIYKLKIYINGLWLNEKGSNANNTTYTLVSSLKLRWLFKEYKFEKVKNGLYKTKDIEIIDIYVVIIGELDPIYSKEYLVLKEFADKRARKQALPVLLEVADNEMLEEILSLYIEEVVKLYKQEKKQMTEALQNKILEFAVKFGPTPKTVFDRGVEKGIEQGKRLERRKNRKEKLRTAISMIQKGFEIDLIAEITGLKKEYLERFFRKSHLR